MRNRRLALRISLTLAAFAIVLGVLATTSNGKKEASAWQSPTAADHRTQIPVGVNMLDRNRTTSTTAIPSVAGTSPLPPALPSTPVGSSSPVATTPPATGTTDPSTSATNDPPSVSSTGPAGDLLAQQSAYVQQVFYCIRHTHESGTDPTAVNPVSGDGGLYQFTDGTWLAHGGGKFASAAQYATVAEQDTVAVWTYEQDGFGPWTGDNSCGF